MREYIEKIVCVEWFSTEVNVGSVLKSNIIKVVAETRNNPTTSSLVFQCSTRGSVFLSDQYDASLEKNCLRVDGCSCDIPTYSMFPSILFSSPTSKIPSAQVSGAALFSIGAACLLCIHTF